MIRVSPQSARNVATDGVPSPEEVVWAVAREPWLERVRDGEVDDVPVDHLLSACVQVDNWTNRVHRREILPITPEAARMVRMRALLFDSDEASLHRVRKVLRCHTGVAPVSEHGEVGDFCLAGCGVRGCSRVECYRLLQGHKIKKHQKWLYRRRTSLRSLVTLSVRWPLPDWEGEPRNPTMKVPGGVGNAWWAKPILHLSHRDPTKRLIAENILQRRADMLGPLRMEAKKATTSPARWSMETSWREPRGDGRWWPQPHIHVVLTDESAPEMCFRWETQAARMGLVGHTHVQALSPHETTVNRLGRYLGKGDTGTTQQRLLTKKEPVVPLSRLASVLDDRSLAEWLVCSFRTSGVWNDARGSEEKQWWEPTPIREKIWYGDAVVEVS